MTDRLKGCTVVFDTAKRAEDAEAIFAAIRMIKGVLTIYPDRLRPYDYAAKEWAKVELWQKIRPIIYPELFTTPVPKVGGDEDGD